MNCHFVTEDFSLVSATLLKRGRCQSAFGTWGEALLLLPFPMWLRTPSFLETAVDWISRWLFLWFCKWLLLPCGGNISWKKGRVGGVRRNAPASPPRRVPWQSVTIRMLFKYFFLSKKLLMLSIVGGEPYLVVYILLGFLLCSSFVFSNSSKGRLQKRLKLNNVPHSVSPESFSLDPQQIWCRLNLSRMNLFRGLPLKRAV